MTCNITRYLLIILLLSGCNSKQQREPKTNAPDSALVEYGVVTVQSDSVLVEQQCVRGQATPIIKRTVYPVTTFQLNKDRLTGIETVVLKNGDTLIIRNWGCEYYALTFRFETTQFEADTTNVRYWLDKSVILMEGIQHGLQAPLDIEKGTAVTKKCRTVRTTLFPWRRDRIRLGNHTRICYAGSRAEIA